MKIGLALSGGGVKGAAHIGVIKALIENKIDFEIIGGTSSGSIVTALYSMGYTPEEMLKLFNYFSKIVMKNSPTYTQPNGKKGLSIVVGGLLSGENISFSINEAAKYKKINTMSELTKKVVIPTVDVDNSEKYVFTNCKIEGNNYIKNGKIDMAVRASCSYPGVFAPCNYRNHRFIDGGILDNIPVDEVKKAGADYIIAVKFALNKKATTRGIAGVASKAVDIMFEKSSINEIQGADYIINVDTKGTSVFDIKKINDCYKYGYEQTLSKINEIKNKIEAKKNLF